MEDNKKLQLINEIKRIERELYLKRSQLAVAEDMLGFGYKAYAVDGLDKEGFLRLIGVIGANSVGGNSVEDVKGERQR